MRDRYWAMFTSIKHKECYYHHYSLLSKQIGGAITAICVLSSVSSVASWAIWHSVPWLWGSIVILSQIIQALSPHFPFSKQQVSLKFLLPRLRKLLLEIDNCWLNLENFEDKKISTLVKDFEFQYANLESQFIEDTYFPILKLCQIKAEKDCKTYFNHYYNV